ncbi:biotin-dependent carboxyltransferase family protein [Candidatus Thioglobus sp.]|uniref:5-oxoprolinase subunit C family protein n=1 Tax=Candidatus Thioglobus sp. TaxID=2026721 RepID=UPI003D11A54C
MSFKVIKSGFLSTIQDYGRFAHTGHGMSQSGALDEHAYCWANRLLDNHYNDAVLEITLGAVQLEALDDMLICVCGADLDFKINHQAAVIWHSVQIKAGDVLSWHFPKHGVRAYLAVKGGFKTQLMFGSRSVNLRENMGTKISELEILNCEISRVKLDHLMPDKYLPNYNQALVLNILPSYQYSMFSQVQKSLFFEQTYHISSANDRSGCRLDGAPIALKKDKMISEPISYGSVQISTNGLPIILLKDGPTIGGYVKIGTVFSLDLAQLAQQQQNAKVRFKLMDVHQAQKQRLKFNQFFGICSNS